MFAPSDQVAHLPLVVIDISDLRSDRRRAAPIDEDDDAVPARRVSRRARIVSAARTNIVRLIPGATRLPFEPASR